MIPLYYDLHIHSCLSPCSDDDMTPANIVGMAFIKGLNVIALTDHNGCKNCPAAMALGKEYNIIVPPDSTFTSAEFHDLKNLHKIRREHPYLHNCNILCNSDAHYLEDIHEAGHQIFAASRRIKDILAAIC